MPRKIDLATIYYWQVEFVEPNDPDDNRYVVLHGDDGEIVGPMTMELAEQWMDHFDGSRAKVDKSQSFWTYPLFARWG